MTTLTMSILKASTADLCYTHWVERQLELIKIGQCDSPLYRAMEARSHELIPSTIMAPFQFKDYTA